MKPRACCIDFSAVRHPALLDLIGETGWEIDVCSSLAEIDRLFSGNGVHFDLVVVSGAPAPDALADVVACVRSHIHAEATPIAVIASEEFNAQAERALESGATEVFSSADLPTFRSYLQSFSDSGGDEHLGKRILVLDDHRVQGLCLQAILNKHGFDAVVFDSAEAALASATDTAYAAVVTDIVLGIDQSGISFIRRWRQSGSSSATAPIIAISGFDDDARRIEALRAGAEAFLPKPVGAAELCFHLRRLLRRAANLGNADSVALDNMPPESDSGEKLSEREHLICALAVSGHRDKQIAYQIGISYWTVRTYLARIFRKLKVSNRVELAASIHTASGSTATPGSQLVGEAKTAVIQWLSLAAHILDEIPHGILVTDLDGRILQVNEAFCEITGYSRQDVLGKNPRIFRSGRHNSEFYTALFARLVTDGSWSGEIWNRNRAGELFLEKLDICCLPPGLPMNAAYVAVISDITEQHKKAERIRESALQDPLTGVANRALLKDRTQLEISRARRSGKHIAFAFIDLDGFKPVNDTFGHAIGDTILQEVASRLSACLRENDTLARIGGDEFVALLPEVSGREAACMLGQRLVDAFHAPFGAHGKHNRLGASIGVSLYPDDGQDFDTLLAHADTAMYRAKQSGGHRVRPFEWHMSASESAALAQETRLYIALQNDEFELLFQPQVDLLAPCVRAAEALLRWRDPEHGLLTAAHFIPLAEKTGIIVELGNWVLHQACAALTQIQRSGRPDFRISVNISPLQILRGEAFVDDVCTALAVHPLTPRTLELEISEAVFMRNPRQTVEVLEALLARGVSLALDGFGKDYFSPGYLRHLAFRAIKIDRHCIGDAATDPYYSSIAKSSLLLAASLGLEAIAEGVENREQRLFLENIGYRHAQGNLFGKPMPLEHLRQRIDRPA